MLSSWFYTYCRWYLPAHEPRHVLPVHFDYSAGRQAQVWMPLLKPSPLAESLSPPAKPYSPAAAGLRGLLTTSSSSPRSSSSKFRTSGFGFSPASRFRSSSSASSSSSNGTRDSFWARVSGASRRRRRAAARAAAASAAAVMHDIGNGVSVPEGDWLVPMRGETQLAVELEMPGWPEPDMVQVRQYACINREYACINREYACIHREYACINREYACINREYACINREYACTTGSMLAAPTAVALCTHSNGQGP